MTIKEARISAGITQAELARRLGCSQQNIWQLEKKANVKATTMKKVADALGMSYMELQGVDSWIPVDESLPGVGKYVLVTADGDLHLAKYGEGFGGQVVTVGFIDSDYKWDTYDGSDVLGEITAWKPLPEPYKEAQHDRSNRQTGGD